jgi:hypothetical protein
MVVFEKYFEESNGQPFDYFGDEIFLSDKIELKLNEQILVTIEKTNSEHIQGIGFSENVSVFNTTVKRAAIFENFSIPPEKRLKTKSELPFSFYVTSKNKKGHIYIYNLALINGVVQYGHNGFAMKKEQIENGWRYRCNDVIPNDDFTDMIFTIQKITN